MSAEDEVSSLSNNNITLKTGKSGNSNTISNGNPKPKKQKSVEILGNKNESKQPVDLSFKIVVIGDSSVGKSSLINKVIKDEFEVGYNATIGFEYCDLYIKVNTKLIKLQIWDTCGQEIYQSVITNFYRNSSLAMMVYAIDNKRSFENLDFWLKEIKKGSNPDAKIILIGNKNDLDEKREVLYDDAKKFSEDFEFSNFIETSAKEGINVKEVFIEIAELLIKNYSDYCSTSSAYISSDRSKSLDNSIHNESNEKGQKLKAPCC